MTMTLSHQDAVARVEAARLEKQRRARECDALEGTPRELSGFVELRAAEEQLAAREAWLDWVLSEH